jgi:hypothetical protein
VTGTAPLFDHVFLVLDDDAYAAVAGSSFLRDDFARVKLKRLTSSIAGTYAGVGVAGTNTIVEFFPASAPPFPGLSAGLSLSFERPGAILQARDRLAAAGLPARSELVRRDVPGEGSRPWYHLLEPELDGDLGIRLMLAEVATEYFDRVGARRGDGGTLARSGYLDAALGGPPDSDRALVDVSGVTLRLTPARTARLAAVLRALGYVDAGAAGEIALRGPDSLLRLVADDTAPEGVTAVELVLRRPVTPPQAFGASSTLDGTTWSFVPHAAPRPTVEAGERR